jgi:tRNA(adenine34) deaminase
MPVADEIWMSEALAEARLAQAAGEVPVGAIVVHTDRIIGRGGNRNVRDNDPSAHAEIVALRNAGKTLGNHRLLDCDLYVTIEPCAMCASAMVHARLRRLIYGANDPKAGAVSSVMQLLDSPSLNHRVQVTQGVLSGACQELVQQFFRARRG